jgi:HEPN domain-containing protein
MSEANEWFKRGEEKLQSAQTTYSIGNFHDAFQLAREAVELLLKSLLIKQGIPISVIKNVISHNLSCMVECINWKMFPNVNQNIIRSKVSQLNNYKLESGEFCNAWQVSRSRYPEDISSRDAEENINIAFEIYNEIKKEFIK